MPALYLNDNTQSASIDAPVGQVLTRNFSDQTSDVHALSNENGTPAAVPESDSWIITADDIPLFSADGTLLEFADS